MGKIKIPKHIAIIMDGNARWAKENNLSLSKGHKEGSQNLQNIVEAAIEYGVKYLTVYAFSSENWQRPKKEVNYLMNLLEEYLDKETKPLIEKDVKIILSGDRQKISDKINRKIENIENITQNNKSLTLNVAFSYGSRQEIISATKNIALALSEQKIKIDDIDENLISQNLYCPNIPDPDLLIRTAGDLRVSNFLLWQIAYSELYFTNKFWPEFSKTDLLAAITEFNKRERRYGKR